MAIEHAKWVQDFLDDQEERKKKWTTTPIRTEGLQVVLTPTSDDGLDDLEDEAIDKWDNGKIGDEQLNIALERISALRKPAGRTGTTETERIVNGVTMSDLVRLANRLCQAYGVD